MSKKTRPTIEDETPQDGKKRVLHVNKGKGSVKWLHSSFRNSPQWEVVTLAADKKLQPDIIGSTTDFSRVKDQSVDAVWLARELDKIPAAKVDRTLEECYRVLKMSGQLVLISADLQFLAEAIVRGQLDKPILEIPGRNLSPLEVLYGVASVTDQDIPRNGFTVNTLGLKLKAAGFVNIQMKRDEMNLHAVGQKLPEGEGKTKISVLDPARGASGNKDELDVPPVQWTPPGLTAL